MMMERTKTMRELILLLIIFNLMRRGSEAATIKLNENWILSNENKSISIPHLSLPSGVYSALEEANLTESVLFSRNDVELRWIARQNWTYTKNFQITAEELKHEFLILTFHGLDTIAEILLNDVKIGSAMNMFVRYRFDMKEKLKEGENLLVINFQSPIEAAKNFNAKQLHPVPPDCPPKVYNGECHMNQLRKMQASFAWDWGLAAPSMGIWKEVEIEVYDSLLIRDVTYEMNDGNSTWNLKFGVYVESGIASKIFEGSMIFQIITIVGPFHQHFKVETDENGEAKVELTMQVSKSSVELWWPNGAGPQTLYDFNIRWEDVHLNSVENFSRSFLISKKSIQIGFRTIELVQEPMDNGLSFYFKVNSVPIFMKGSNWIPAHILPEKSANEAKISELLSAARDAHMNMLRVWGGGVYESETFYDLADRFGILIWQDMMFACAMYPSGDFLKNVRVEVNQQIRRLQHRASIALFAGNNENEAALRQDWYGTEGNYSIFAEEYKELYIDTIVDEIRKIDSNRILLPSSPSNGAWQRDRDEFGISKDPQNHHFGDIHFYPLSTNSWRPETFHQPRFASEFGFQSFPQGWKEIARESYDIIDLINHRQHHPLNNTLITFLVQENLNVDFNSLKWEDQVYLSQVSQAMALKVETEVYRSGRGNFMNTMGALYWQLNDVWVAPSWSSIEFNGNFKIVHHWMSKVFAPVSIITQLNLMNKLVIYGVSDETSAPLRFMKIQIDIHRFDDLLPVDSLEFKFDMKSNSVTAAETLDLFNYLHQKNFNVYEHFILFHLYDLLEPNQVIASNFLFPGNFENLKAVKDPNVRLSFISNKCDKNRHTIRIDVKVDFPAIFLWINLQHEKIKKFKLSRNGFIQVQAVESVLMTFENENCEAKVEVEDLMVKVLNKFLM